MSRIGMMLIVLLALMGGAFGAEDKAAGPAVGDKAPAFSLKGTDGKEHALADDIGKRPIVIAWFPKAFTSG